MLENGTLDIKKERIGETLNALRRQVSESPRSFLEALVKRFRTHTADQSIPDSSNKGSWSESGSDAEELTQSYQDSIGDPTEEYRDIGEMLNIHQPVRPEKIIKEGSGAIYPDGNILISEDFTRGAVTYLKTRSDNMQPVAIFSVINGRLFVSTKEKNYGFRAAKWLQDVFEIADLTLIHTDDFLTHSSDKIFYQGKIDSINNFDNFDNTDETITETSQGYIKVAESESRNVLNDLYREARNRGNYLLARVVDLPALPNFAASATIFMPGAEKLFDNAYKLAHDQGTLLYEVPESACPLAFDHDVSTYIYRTIDEVPEMYKNPDKYKQVDWKGLILIWDKNAQSMNLADLARLVDNKPPTSWTEVIFDPNDEDVKLVGIVNSKGVLGWSKIAQSQGVKEFTVVPSFD